MVYMNEHLLEGLERVENKLNITSWLRRGIDGRGVRCGVLGFESGSHHNGEWQLQYNTGIELIVYDVMGEMSFEEALDRAYYDNVDVIVCAIRKTGWSAELEALSRRLYEKGVIMINSSHNEGREIDAFPALSVYWFAVGEYVERLNAKSGDSGYGDKLDFLMYSNMPNLNRKGSYVSISHTSGCLGLSGKIACLLKAYMGKNFGPEEFGKYIHLYCDRLGREGRQRDTGWGLLMLPDEPEKINLGSATRRMKKFWF